MLPACSCAASQLAHCPSAHVLRVSVQAAQIQLDKAADDFAALHKGRQELIRQWEDAMEQMRRNDEAIQHATGLFASKKSELRKLQERLDASAKFLDNELVNNKERDAQIQLLERDVGRLREVYAAEQVRPKARRDPGVCVEGL